MKAEAKSFCRMAQAPLSNQPQRDTMDNTTLIILIIVLILLFGGGGFFYRGRRR